MRELYKCKRHKLTYEERKLFPLPQSIRRKTSVEAIKIWVLRVEAIFEKYKEKVQSKVDTWLTSWTPVKNQRERLQSNNDNKLNKNDSNI